MSRGQHRRLQKCEVSAKTRNQRRQKTEEVHSSTLQIRAGENPI
jgi:hypothetical protein